MKPNHAGQTSEDNVAAILRHAGIRCDRQVMLPQPGIYGYDLRVDFLARNLVRFPDGLIIESKWQDCAGSADEKLPYLVANIKTCYALPTIVVAAGGGCRPGARSWLQQQRDGRHLVDVFSLEELASWANRSDKRPEPTLFRR